MKNAYITQEETFEKPLRKTFVGKDKKPTVKYRHPDGEDYHEDKKTTYKRKEKYQSWKFSTEEYDD